MEVDVTTGSLLVAGATGHLGRALLEVGLERGYQTTAVARRPEALDSLREHGSLRVVQAQVTEPGELRGLCDGIETVVSALGVTRQPGRTSFRDVDYQANRNLLDEAQRAGVRKFIVTSGFGIEDSPKNAMYAAKLRFERELIESGVPYLIIRPTGFFSDMMMLFEMARQGRIYLLGPGTGRLNPIHLTDLAEYFFQHLGDENAILEVGGPESYSFNEIAALAFSALGRPASVTHVSLTAVRVFLPLVRLFSLNTYTEVRAFARIMVHGAEAPPFGHRGLREAFHEAAQAPPG